VRGEDDYGEGFVDEGVGAVLHFAGGVAFGVDVGDFFELERAFEGDGEVDAAAEVEKVAGVEKLLASSSHCWEHVRSISSILAGMRPVLRRAQGFGGVSWPRSLGQIEGEEEERGDLGGEGFGGGDADFGAGVGVDGAGGVAGDHGSDDVADGDGFGAEGDHFALGGEGVGGFAGLGDEQAEGVGVGDGRAVAVFAGVVDFDGDAGEALDHVFAGEAACQLVPQAAMLMLVICGEFSSGSIFISLRKTWPESSETRPRVVSRMARGCSQISLSMKCL
jgi:hypothetical protein